MAPARARRRRTGVRRCDRPQRCQRCREMIVWGRIIEPSGRLRTYRDGHLVHVPLNAVPVPMGRFEYVRGTVGRPVVRELDELERIMPSEADRFMRHYDLPAGEL